MNFYSLKVSHKEYITPEAITLSFDVPADIAHAFEFKSGQYLTFKQQVSSEEVRRSYSICAPEGKGQLRVGIKKVEDGLFSNFVHENINIGDEIKVSNPQGRFTLCAEDSDQNILMVAAGSGITPILSHIETLLGSGGNDHITLIYSNKTPKSAMFRARLDALKNMYLERFNIVYIYSSIAQEVELFSGRIDQEKCRAILDNWVGAPQFDHVYLCGPEAMINDLKSLFIQMDYPQTSIHYELFGTQIPRAATKQVAKENGQGTALTVMLDGVAHEVSMHQGERVLEAARRHNLDAPFSCQGGICSTCKCKILEGAGEMEINHALEDYEVENGYALSCQLMPQSEKLVISYDEGH